MPSRLNEQLAGKYKNISFGVRKETLNNVGQSRVVHKYPKSSIQYAESMGEEPFDCTVDLFFAGDNFKDDFNKFKRAIQSSAPGRLFLPTYGIKNSIVALPSSFESDQKTIGEITASINFIETISKPSPVESDISEQDVAEKGQECRDKLKESFAKQYISPTIINNALTAKLDAVGLSGLVSKAVNSTRSSIDFLRKIDRAIRDPEQYANLLLSSVDPLGYLQYIAQSFTGPEAFNIFKKIATTGSSLSNSMNDIIDGINPEPSTITPQTYINTRTDFNINLWDDNTTERINRNTARLATVNTFRLVGLIGMYEGASNKSYTTTDEIQADIEILEDYYTNIVENDSTGIIILSMKPLLDDLRNLTNNILSLKKQQAYTITEIEILRPTSCYLLSYKLYGEYLRNEAQHEFISDLLAGLNRSIPRDRLQGLVRVVEIGR